MRETYKKQFGRLFKDALDLERSIRGDQGQLNSIQMVLFNDLFRIIQELWDRRR